MGWRFWASDTSEAEKSLEALQRGAPATDRFAEIEDEIFVTLTANPADRSPGSPLACLNEGGAVSVGDAVQLATSFTTQETRIVSITRDGVPCSTLDFDERGDIVLSEDTDLSEVYRTSILTDPGTEDASSEQHFLVQVHSAEQRGKDVYVVGRSSGEVTSGVEVVVSPWTDPTKRFAKVTMVEQLADARVGILLAKHDASAMEHGDEIVHFTAF
jgi:hypothetical protein